MMANDVNMTPVVTESGVVEVAPTENVDQVVTDNGVKSTEGVPQEAAATPAEKTEEQAVPYSRFQEVNEQKKAYEAQIEQLQGHLKLVGNQQPKQAQEPTQQEGMTMQVMKRLGVDPDYATPAEMAKVNDTVMQLMVSQVTAQNQAQNFVRSHSDFAEVVGTNDPVTGQFVYAPPLARVLSESPELITALQNAGTGANALAYKLGVSDAVYQTKIAESKKADVIATAENAVKGLTSVSAVGTNGVIDKSAQISQMTDVEHQAHVAEILKRGGVSI